MAKELTGFGATVKKEDVNITVTLEKIVTLGKTECLQLNSVVTCDKFAPPLPPGIAVDKGSVKSTFSATIPVAASLCEPGEGATAMTMTVTGRGKPDASTAEVVVQITNEQSLTERTAEVK
jgi:hypothetical protein